MNDTATVVYIITRTDRHGRTRVAMVYDNKSAAANYADIMNQDKEMIGWTYKANKHRVWS